MPQVERRILSRMEQSDAYRVPGCFSTSEVQLVDVTPGPTVESPLEAQSARVQTPLNLGLASSGVFLSGARLKRNSCRSVIHNEDSFGYVSWFYRRLIAILVELSNLVRVCKSVYICHDTSCMM